jgi:hypothetical protein
MSAPDARIATALQAFAAASPDIERCPANPSFAKETLDGRIAQRHDYVLFAASRGDWAQAMDESYEAARQAMSMLLLHEGWRVPDVARGKHLVLAEAAAAWLESLDPPGPRVARSFASARKARNNWEYPDARAPVPDEQTLRGMTLDNVRLVNFVRRVLDLPGRDDWVPTPENVEQWQRRS